MPRKIDKRFAQMFHCDLTEMLWSFQLWDTGKPAVKRFRKSLVETKAALVKLLEENPDIFDNSEQAECTVDSASSSRLPSGHRTKFMQQIANDILTLDPAVLSEELKFVRRKEEKPAKPKSGPDSASGSF